MIYLLHKRQQISISIDALADVRPRVVKWAPSEKIIFFFCKINKLVLFVVGPSNEMITKRMIMRLQLLNQLNFVWRHTYSYLIGHYNLSATITI